MRGGAAAADAGGAAGEGSGPRRRRQVCPVAGKIKKLTKLEKNYNSIVSYNIVKFTTFLGSLHPPHSFLL